MGKVVLITGVTGQDGSYLAELCLEKGYDVYGLVRRLSRPNVGNIKHVMDDMTLVDGDLLDQSSLNFAVKESEPDYIFNLASQSFVATSFKQPVLTAEVTGLGVIRMLAAMKEYAPDARFLQASSSEMYGQATVSPQHELTRFHPRSPYGISKLFGYWACVNYREAYDMFVANAICYNHESPRRGFEFVTRKISSAVAEIHLGVRRKLVLGNTSARRDWGYAPDYVDLMYRILQYKEPHDFVGATGENYSVQDFVDEAFKVVGRDPDKYVLTDKMFMRPAEIEDLRGDASKARRLLDWEAKVRFPELVRIMVEADLDRMESA